ncbi:MAG: NADH-quinone oxidoreductase subunit NuoK [Thermonemataceae bacterium]|nr:NADH-quinone oxidoreductase subunit NuoK [Thermonemataceae bacterium]
MQIYLLLGLFLFSIGLYLVLSKKNALLVLVGVELMLNAANVNFLTFGNFHQQIDGQVTALLIMVVAAAETAIALAIILQLYKQFKNTNLDVFKSLKG